MKEHKHFLLNPQNLKVPGKINKLDNNTAIFNEEITYIPPHLQGTYKKNITLTTFPKTPHLINKPKNYNKLHNSFSFIYKPQHIQGKSFKLPAVSDLLNLSPKNLDKEFLENYIESVYYAQSIETEYARIQKELTNQQYLNKFLLMSQKKKDDMISYLFEENRALKNEVVELQKSLEKIKHKNFKTPLLTTNLDGSFYNTSMNPRISANLVSIPSQHTINNVPTTKKPSPFLSALTDTFVKRKTKVYEDNLAYKNLLNMNLNIKSAELMYDDNAILLYLKPIFEDEDSFLSFVTGSDTNEMVAFYNQVLALLTEHKCLYSLILRLKRIIVAGNTMTESLVLTEAMKKIVEETCEFLKCDRATVFLLDDQKQELWSKVGAGLSFTIRIPWNKGIVGHAVVNGEVVNIMDAYSDPRFNQEFDRKIGYKTETILVCPIFDQSKRVTGAVQAINKFNGYFTKEDEGLLGILANLAGSALRNSIQYDEQLLFLNNLRHILKQGIQLHAAFNFETMIPTAEDLLKSTMNVEKALIFLVDLEKNLLLHYEKTGEIKTFDINCGIAGHIAKKGFQESFLNAYQTTLYNGTIDIDTALPLICVPVKDRKDKVIGVFEVVNPKGIQGIITNQKSKISSMDYETLDFFAQQLAQGILNIYELGKILLNK